MRIYFVFFILFISACGVVGSSVSKKFTFFKHDKPSHLSIQVPKGFRDEKIKLGNDGKEQFYTYPDSSIFFIGLNVTWPTANQQRRLVPYTDSLEMRNGIHNGVDSDGLYWKEIYVDLFIVGYSRVPAARRESFERAVNSVRFK